MAFTERAVADLAAIKVWYLQPGSGSSARARLGRLLFAINGLQALPCFYALGNAPGSRVMVCGGHRVLYEVSPDTGDNATAGNVMILRVLGPGQQ